MRLNIVSIRKTLITTCFLLLIGLLAGSVIAFGQIESTPNVTETPTATATTTPAATATTPLPTQGMSLNITANPSIITVNTPTKVTFTVTIAGVPVSNATVTLGGVESANNMTNAAGSTVINVNASAAGTINAIASAPGYAIVTTTITVTGPNPFASWWVIVGIIAGGELVLFLITRCSPRESNSNKTTQSNNTGNSQSNTASSHSKTASSHSKTANPQSDNTTNKSWDLACFCITPGMFISFSFVWISSAVWIWGFSTGNFLLATIGAGVIGGIIYDIVVSKGEVLLPKVDTDGISLGALYGGALGFASSIMVINSVLEASSQVLPNHSLIAFLSALGLKGFSEFSATTQLITKKKASISFNIDSDNATGEIVTNEKVIELQVVYLHFQKDKVSINPDIKTDGEGKFNFVIKDLKLSAGEWEAWASWDGNDRYDKAESMHKKFNVAAAAPTSTSP